MGTLLLDVPLVGQKTGNDGRLLTQPNASGKLTQHGFMACWYAAACMVSYYYRAGPRLGLPEIWEPDAGLPMTAISRLARVEGLVTVDPPSEGLTSDSVLDMLRTSGPIWAAGHYLEGHPSAGHVIVLTGIEGSVVHYNDPWEPAAKTKSVDWISNGLWSLPNALLAAHPSVVEGGPFRG